MTVCPGGTWRMLPSDVVGRRIFERELGLSESAFVPHNVRTGEGDMFIHASFTAPPSFLDPDNILHAWAIIRTRHPLLASRVILQNDSDWQFQYSPCDDPGSAKKEANACLRICHSSKEELIENHLNGSRILSTDCLSHLTISTSSTNSNEHDLFLVTPHFLGDGTSLNTTVNELFMLLAEPATLIGTLAASIAQSMTRTPTAFETRLPAPKSAFQAAAQKVSYQIHQAKDIGGHTLPRQNIGERKTIILEFSLPPDQTARLLKLSKNKGVTISSLILAILTIAWSSVSDVSNPELPILLYTAFNLRAHLSPASCSYWFLALSYLTIMLPSFLPAKANTNDTIWCRAMSARVQMLRSTTSPCVASRSLCMAQERYSNSIAAPKPPIIVPTTEAPNSALCGISLMGNLDNIYSHAAFPSDVEIHGVITASRQRPGGFLFINQTLKGRMCLQLVWDQNGFRKGAIEKFWNACERLCLEACEQS